MTYCKSPRDNLKSVGGHRYCVILRKGLEHPWIWISLGVLELIPWGGRGTTVFSHTDHPCVGPPPVTCLDFLFRIYCPEGHTASLEGEDGAFPRAIQHLHLNFTKTCRKTVPATGPSATGQLFRVNSNIFLELCCILWGWEGLWEITQFVLLRLGRMELSLCRQLGGSL